MALYLNVSGSFPRELGMIRLRRLIGENADAHILRLWLFSMENFGNEKMLGVTPTDIEMAADWTGSDGELFRALVDSGMIVGHKVPEGEMPIFELVCPSLFIHESGD